MKFIQSIRECAFAPLAAQAKKCRREFRDCHGALLLAMTYEVIKPTRTCPSEVEKSQKIIDIIKAPLQRGAVYAVDWGIG